MLPSKDPPVHTPISLAIPASFTDIYANMARQTSQIGRIARAACIFCVDEILIYSDKSIRKQKSQRQFITKVLEYLETPQYLRKHIFGKLPELRYVGLLPPLRTPHHPIEKHSQKLHDAEIREGYAFKKGKQLLVDVGVEYPLLLQKPHPDRIPNRVTVQIIRTANGSLEAKLTSPLPGKYWGYRVFDIQEPIGTFLKNSSKYDLTIATSRRASTINKVWRKLKISWRQASRILVLFGSYEEGLVEIFQGQGNKLSSLVDFVVNTAPGQGVATIRTEEAVFLSLAVLRLLETDI
jgi:predicted SPOUT superfamily RNA methylase MTH1